MWMLISIIKINKAIPQSHPPPGPPLFLFLLFFFHTILRIGPLKIVKAPYNGSIPGLEYHQYAWTKVNFIFIFHCVFLCWFVKDIISY
jgi:hypothetical protein